jgi:hypothetical protein
MVISMAMLGRASSDALLKRCTELTFKEEEMDRFVRPRNNPKVPWVSKKHPVGQRVAVKRPGDKDHGAVGVVVASYYTHNGYYHNPCYVVQLDNGKVKKYQNVTNV